MQAQKSKTGSQLIATFAEQEHQLKLAEDKKRINELRDSLSKRKDGIEYFQKQREMKFNDFIMRQEKFKSLDDHKIPLNQFCQKYQTNARTGITTDQATKRYLMYGPNESYFQKHYFWTLAMLKEIVNPFSVLLWIDAILCFVVYGLQNTDSHFLYLGIAILIITLVNSVFVLYPSIKNNVTFDSFLKTKAQQVTVVRNGQEIIINTVDLVIGDVMKIEAGKRLPADLRIIQATCMKVDNYPVTGEIILQRRSPQCTSDNILETQNFAFASTFIKEGSGKGIIFSTGDRTLINQIGKRELIIGDPQKTFSKFIQKRCNFIMKLSIFTFVTGIIFFCLGFAVGYSTIYNFIILIGIITAGVPQIFFTIASINAILTSKSFISKKILCKNIDSLYNLGSISCIHSDKLKTLSINKIAVCYLWYDGKICKGDRRQNLIQNFQLEYDVHSEGFQLLQTAALVCTKANFSLSLPKGKIEAINQSYLSNIEKQQKIKQEQIKWKQKLKKIDLPTVGDTIQSSIIHFFQPINDILKIREKYPIINDQNGYQVRVRYNMYVHSSINEWQTADSHYCLFTKGSPEAIQKLCISVNIGGTAVQKTQQWNKKFNQALNIFNKNGQRKLAFSIYHLPKTQYPKNYKFDIGTKNFELNKQTFVGMISFFDPPRDQATSVIFKCRSAGLKFMMVTGDMLSTAVSFAERCYLINNETVNQIAERKGQRFEQVFNESDSIVIHGDSITSMMLQDQDLPDSQQGYKLQKWLSKNQIVFARVTPAQKFLITKANMKKGEFVAVVSNSVSDSTAMKAADVGISMMNSGADVTKEVADILLMEDDLTLILMGIQQSKLMFGNLKKSICYVLTSQVPQLLPFIVTAIFQFPLPLTPVLALYISIFIDFMPALAFNYQRREIDIMTKSPKVESRQLVTLPLMCQSYGFIGWTQFWGAMFCYFVIFNDFGFRPNELLLTANAHIVLPSDSDIYNPSIASFGNSIVQNHIKEGNCPDPKQLAKIDWISTKHVAVDLRMAALRCNMMAGKPVFSQVFNWGSCNVQLISPHTNKPVCYTTQAVKYAQSGYFYGVVVCQIFNIFVCKTRIMSVVNQGIQNSLMFVAIGVQISLCVLIGYCLPFNIAFGTRDNLFRHFGVPAIPFAMIQIIIEQARKYIIRTLQKDSSARIHWFVRAAIW